MIDDRDWPARTLCGGDRREVFASIDLGFQGALNWFRCHTGAIGRAEIELFSGKAIDVPALFLSGIADWGTYRKPGAVERMRTVNICERDVLLHRDRSEVRPRDRVNQHIVKSTKVQWLTSWATLLSLYKR